MATFLSASDSAFDAVSAGAVMMSLGPLRFGVSTQEYESLKTAMSWRWAEKARYLRAPALQYHGPATITKTFDVTIVVEKGADLNFIPSLQSLGDEGKPQRLVAGHSRPVAGVNMLSGGSDMGLWCLTDLALDESEFMRDGLAILVKATITIKSYGDDA
ncbi:MAG: phage tail protein [Aeromonas veronii]